MVNQLVDRTIINTKTGLRMDQETSSPLLPEEYSPEGQLPIGQEKKWYIIKAYSGFENYVHKALEKRIKESDMTALFGEIRVPTETVVEMRRGQKTTSERKCYPGYVLVQMVMNDDTWHMVREIPKVLGFVGGTGTRPVPISEKEVNQMQSGVDKPKPKIVYEVGEVIRIIDGPFTDFNGVVEEVNYEKNRLRVAVLIFGRSTPVELEFGQVAKS